MVLSLMYQAHAAEVAHGLSTTSRSMEETHATCVPQHGCIRHAAGLNVDEVHMGRTYGDRHEVIWPLPSGRASPVFEAHLWDHHPACTVPGACRQRLCAMELLTVILGMCVWRSIARSALAPLPGISLLV